MYFISISFNHDEIAGNTLNISMKIFYSIYTGWNILENKGGGGKNA